MKELIIGDTPEQLGTIESAGAFLVDGMVVTRSDYIALRNRVPPPSCSGDWFDHVKKQIITRPPVGAMININGVTAKVIAHERTTYSVFEEVIAVVFSSRDSDGVLNLGFEVNLANITPAN
jgi:hypothetical protein